MKTLIVSLVLLLLTGCGTIFSSQSELHPEVGAVRPLETVDITYEKLSLFETNMKCMELMGYPKVIFPWYTIFACADFPSDEQLSQTGGKPWCHIIHAYDWTLTHEHKHCTGLDD